MSPRETEEALQTPDWYKDVVIYQLHVKSFCDGTGDGIGDFKGLLSRLDYLENLGVTALWLLPFYPSPLRDDGYDIADYRQVHPDYGTLADFKRFLEAAHARGMRVITELVLNHTSDQHAWFQRARRARPGSAARNFYVWNDSTDRYREARIIFQDFELSNWSWDPVARAYFWHRFYAHQPDLNFDNPKVHEALFKVLDFWFAMGVDGMRLDAIPYLYEREGTNCENLPETYEFIKQLRRRVQEKFPDRMLLAEANQWPEDAARYFGDGEGCHMCFHFPLMPRMYMALEMESRHPVTDILEQTPEIPENCQWALFLRNHDELTLEMVTDEERDYMYRIYVKDPRARVNLGIRRRLAPLLGNDRRKIELMNVLLLTLPGSPIIYYGDEIGMGDNYYLGDRDGVRTPMQWNTDANAGFSRANPQKLFLPLVIDPEYNHSALNVATQEERSSSLLWWMRRVIDLRRSTACFGRGAIEFLKPDNPRVLAYLRSFGDEHIVVLANLSRHAQMVQLELTDFAGCVPEDRFSGNRFLPVTESPYPLCLGPYGYYILTLTSTADEAATETAPLPRLRGTSWLGLADDRTFRQALERRVLPRYLPRQRWYGGKARSIRKVAIRDAIPLSREKTAPQVLLVEVTYQEGDPELYILPLALVPAAAESRPEDGEVVPGAMAQLLLKEGSAWLCEGIYSPQFTRGLIQAVAAGKRLAGSRGRLQASANRTFRNWWRQQETGTGGRLLGAEQSNTSLVLGEEYIFKLFRRSAPGIHPDLEIVRHLSEKVGFTQVPAYAGAIEYRQEQEPPVVLGLLQRFVPNQGDAWQLFLDQAERYLDRVLVHSGGSEAAPGGPGNLVAALAMELPNPLDELISGVTLEMAGLLGRRTAELHQALARGRDEAFCPEAFTSLYQRALFQSMQNQARQQLRQLQKALPDLPPACQDEARQVLARQPDILARMRTITSSRLTAQRIRTHGDYHLGQVLFTGSDFVIFDFEGEPARPLSERRLKRSPLRDVAGMVRSFQYAAYSVLRPGSTIRQVDSAALAPWADRWYQFVAIAFLRGYLDAMAGSDLIPGDPRALNNLLTPYLLEKALYELGYELNNRPEWLTIPLRGLQLLCEG